MKTQFKVINRTTRIEQILNASEVARFFTFNNIREYAISTVKTKEHKMFETVFISFASVVFVVCLTKIILQWI